MALMKVEDALARLLASAPTTKIEDETLGNTAGRVLAEDLKANRNQPPFDASAMDGYAVKSECLTEAPMRLQVVGEVPAGHTFPDRLHRWEAVRIFTGAPVPEGADAILIQENAERDGAFVTALETVEPGQYIRPANLDFKAGETLITKGTLLDPRHVALAASMNHAKVPVHARPKVAILATGDELVPPGETPRDDQIISSNNYGISAQARAAGADILDLGIAKDIEDEIVSRIKKAQDWGADILVTIGGASVGDHDLVQGTLKSMGMELDFWRIAMRPGKPLMAGQLGDMQVLGLPGNPVSAMTCSILFLLPLIRKMQGLEQPQIIEQASLGAEVPANDLRQSYMRASLAQSDSGALVASPFSGQDSAMMAGFARADCFIIRPPHAPIGKAGDPCQIIRL